MPSANANSRAFENEGGDVLDSSTQEAAEAQGSHLAQHNEAATESSRVTSAGTMPGSMTNEGRSYQNSEMGAAV